MGDDTKEPHARTAPLAYWSSPTSADSAGGFRTLAPVAAYGGVVALAVCVWSTASLRWFQRAEGYLMVGSLSPRGEAYQRWVCDIPAWTGSALLASAAAIVIRAGRRRLPPRFLFGGVAILGAAWFLMMFWIALLSEEMAP